MADQGIYSETGIQAGVQRGRLDDGVEMSISDDARIKMNCDDSGHVVSVGLDQGSAVFDSSSLNKSGQPLVVITPVARIEDRGTVFSVASTAIASLLYVWSDRVFAEAGRFNTPDPIKSTQTLATKVVSKGEAVLIEEGEIVELKLPAAIQETLKEHQAIAIKPKPEAVNFLGWQKENEVSATLSQGTKSTLQLSLSGQGVRADLQNMSPIVIDLDSPVQFQGQIEPRYDPDILDVKSKDNYNPREWATLLPGRSLTETWKVTPLHRSSSADLSFHVNLRVTLIDRNSPLPKDVREFDCKSRTLSFPIVWTWVGAWKWLMALPALLKGSLLGSMLLAFLWAIYKDKIYPWIRRRASKAGINLPVQPPGSCDSDEPTERPALDNAAKPAQLSRSDKVQDDSKTPDISA